MKPAALMMAMIDERRSFSILWVDRGGETALRRKSEQYAASVSVSSGWIVGVKLVHSLSDVVAC